jgi:NAD(P)-dependent dehydrogenase (short-subunit alcohol dehydrogenase family)
MSTSAKVAFITGADRGLGLALSAGLLQLGWRVFAGQYMPTWPDLDQLSARFPGRLTPVLLDVGSIQSARAAAQRVSELAPQVDLLVNNAGVISPKNSVPIMQEQDYAEMHREFDINALGPLRVVETFLPLLEKSMTRRLCFVSSEAGSISASNREGWFGYCMSKAAVNMMVKNLFNSLRPAGYTFRVYHPGWMRTYMGGEKNMRATLEPEEAAVFALDYFLSGLEGVSPFDEDHLVLRDYQGKEYLW